MDNEKTPNKPFKAAIINIGPAFKSAGFYIAVGLLFGFALVLLANNIHHSESLQMVFYPNHIEIAYLLIEHLGTGFIVSALAVFFYEWGAHIKHALDLSNQLKNGVQQINNLLETTKLSNRLVNVLDSEYTQRGNPEFEKSLEFLLTEGDQSPIYLSDLTKNISSIAKAVRDIRKNNSWATEQYVEFINYLLTNVVELNARTLEHVSKKQDGEYPFSVPPDGARMADEILATHMRALSQGDTYDVISHVSSWKHLLDFHKESIEAVINRGVRIRRVFNFRIRYKEEPTPEQIKKILESHLKDVENLADENGTKRYEVKVVRQAEIDKELVSSEFLERLPSSHFGIFAKNVGGTDKSKIRVKVQLSNLSDMKLSSDEQLYKSDVRMFEEAWDIGSDLTDKIIEEIFEEWKKLRSKREIAELSSETTDNDSNSS